MSNSKIPIGNSIDPSKIKLFTMERPSTLVEMQSKITSQNAFSCAVGKATQVAPHNVENDPTEAPLVYLDRAAPLDRSSFPNQPLKKDKPPKATIPNIHHLLKSYKIPISYDVINKKLKIVLPNYAGSSENASNVALTQILSLAAMNGMGPGAIPAILEVLGDRNPYNPVADWITSKPWDGIDRLQALYDTLVESEDYPKPLKEVLMQRWMISGVAAALMPQGFYCRGILTLQGPQSIGKTSWIRALISDPVLRERVLKLDHHLDASNKDSLITAVTHWIVEIGELDSSLKKDVARLKGFITSDRDKLRRPYARSDSEYQRRTVFCASVNDHAFLVDATGNTRFWTIPVTSINYAHDSDMQQVWAQVAVLFQNGETWWLDPNEERLLERYNNDHRAISVIREQILANVDLDRAQASNLKAFSATEMLKQIGNDRPSNPQCKECAGILRELFGQPKKIQGTYKWRIPIRAGQFDKLLPDPIDDDDKY
jgi:putative DNA primase/helicase